MSPSLAALEPHLATVLGLIFGVLARIGHALDQGVGLNRRQIVAQVLMLGVCYTIAETGSDIAHVVAPGVVGFPARMLTAAGIALAASNAVGRLRLATEARLDRRFPTDGAEPPK